MRTIAAQPGTVAHRSPDRAARLVLGHWLMAGLLLAAPIFSGCEGESSGYVYSDNAYVEWSSQPSDRGPGPMANDLLYVVEVLDEWGDPVPWALVGLEVDGQALAWVEVDGDGIASVTLSAPSDSLFRMYVEAPGFHDIFYEDYVGGDDDWFTVYLDPLQRSMTGAPAAGTRSSVNRRSAVTRRGQ